MKKMITLTLYKKDRLIKKYDKVKSILMNDNISFIIEDIKTTIKKDKFIRENKEYKFELDITKKEATYYLKESNILFDIEVEEIMYIKKINSIILKYKLSSDEESTKIEIKIEGDLNE